MVMFCFIRVHTVVKGGFPILCLVPDSVSYRNIIPVWHNHGDELKNMLQCAITASFGSNGAGKGIARHFRLRGGLARADTRQSVARNGDRWYDSTVMIKKRYG